MSKKNFVSLILGTIGGILFALGMCMALVTEWNAMEPGIMVGVVGMVVLLVMVAVRRKMSGKSIFIRLSVKTVIAVLIGIGGALLLGAGMSLVMVWNLLLQGIAIGLVGIVLLLCLIPLIAGVQ